MVPRNRSITILTLATIILFPGCASIVSYGRFPVTMNSDPSAAQIVIRDRKGRVVHTGTTPVTLDLSAKNGFFLRAGYDVHYSMEGYDDHHEVIDYKINEWYWGNILLGGAIGMLIVDPATGAMYKVKNPYVNARLVRSTYKE